MNTDGLKKWTLTAELISAVAVIITLIFLVVGMKENTNALQAQTFQELMRDVNNWRSSIRELESTQLMSKWRVDGIDGVSKEELDVLRIVYLELWGIYEAAFFANERGVLGADEWSRFEKVICRERQTYSNVFWGSGYEGLFSFAEILTPLFVEYVEVQCK
jgi:hypothetical protein